MWVQLVFTKEQEKFLTEFLDELNAEISKDMAEAISKPSRMVTISGKVKLEEGDGV